MMVPSCLCEWKFTAVQNMFSPSLENHAHRQPLVHFDHDVHPESRKFDGKKNSYQFNGFESIRHETSALD